MTIARRHRAALLAATFVVTQLVVPLAHLVGHANDHTHGPAGALDVSALDPSSFLDASGRPDLGALQRALDDAHARQHADGTTHDHDEGTPLEHALGASEHFDALLASGPDALPETACRPFAAPVEPFHEPAHVVVASRFLTVQRAQAPPA